MLSVSDNFKRQLIADNRDYLYKISMLLSDGVTSLTLTNNDIWGDRLKIEEATSSSESFDLGSAVIGKCDITINDITQKFSQYDFFNATFTLYFGINGDTADDGSQIYYRKGLYTVDSAEYNGSLITLNGLDNMWRFDTDYSDVTGLLAVDTIGSIIGKICNTCGVTLATTTFHGYNTYVSTSVDGDYNCREILSYLAQICCCYCRINNAGELVLSWYDKESITGIVNYDGGTYNTTTTPYSDGDAVDGGTFAFNDGDSADGGTFTDLPDMAWVTHNSSITVGTDDIVITGCRVCTSDTDSDTSYDYLWVDSTVEADHERYVLVIQDNPFVTASTAQTIATDVGSILSDTEFRTFNASSLNDITYECGDTCALTDFRGNRFYSFITNLSFTSSNYETFSCGAESIAQNKSIRYSETIKTLVEAKKNAQEVVSDYNKAVQNMNDLAQEAIGYNEYTEKIDGKTVMFRYNGTTVDTTTAGKPKFSDSTVVFKMSGDGVFVSTSKDSQGYEQYTNGYDANSGTAILNLLYVNGLNADWINAGTISCSRLSGGEIDGQTITGGSITGATITVNGGMFTQIGTGYLHLAENTSSDCWKFDIGEHYCNCMYYDDGAWHWVNGGTYPIWKYLSGAYSPSDRRVKENIVELDEEISKNLILNTKTYSFNYIYDTSKLNFGVIAQEVDENLKSLGITENNGLVETHYDSEDTWSVEYKQYVPFLIKTVQVQQKEIDSLKQEIENLKERIG